MEDLSGKTIRAYDLRQRIGAGGFGTVYRAYQPVVQRDVAIKIILPDHANQPEFIRRFEAEAQFVARLEHIHIAPLYDYWRDPDGAYLVMRWLRGGNLQESLQRISWSLANIARLVDQIASALTFAHRSGVIHRDIKPANILLDEEQNAFLSDFGIAVDILKVPEITPEDGFLGSPAYVSPEQILGDSISPQSDIYSFGIVLFELLTGQLPFDAPTDAEILQLHVNQALPPLNDFRSDLPAALDMVLRRATDKDPLLRHPNALKLAEDLHAIATAAERTEQITGPRPRPSASPMDTLQLAEAPKNPDKIVTAQLGTRKLPVLIAPRNPFKGLRPFEEADAGDFFGRDILIQGLLKQLAGQDVHARFMAVVGPSGSGKSSLVKAGLIPVLRRDGVAGSSEWLMAQMIPGVHPLGELVEALSRVAVVARANLAEELLQGTETLHDVMGQILPESSELLLLIDQFEELFTLTKADAERACFLNNLVEAITAADSRLRLIVTLRADFFDRPLFYPGFGELIRQNTEVILPLTPEELRDTIVAPASRSGLSVEPQLVEAMVADVREQPGALPLLQYALTELFEQREGEVLSQSGYERIGGVSGALARRADALYQSLDADHRESARQFFLRLVNPGEGSETTRRRVLQPELEAIPHSHALLALFGEHRLLTLDRDPATRTPTVELAHEALIREWGELRQWVESNREALQVQRRLSAETAEWLAAKRAPGFLATGARLAQFEGLLDVSALALSEDERAYLAASIAVRQRAENRRRQFIAALIGFSIVALAFAVFAFDRQRQADAERVRADHEAALSRSRELAVTALTNLDKQPDLSLLLSVESLGVADTYEARNSLLTGLQAQPNLLSILHGSGGALRTVAVDPLGRWLAAGGTDDTIMLWDLQTHQPVGAPLAGHTGAINSLNFSPDGRLLASGSDDQTIRLWDVATGASVGDPLAGHTDAVWTVQFNPDGTLLASGSSDQTIRLWDVATGASVGDPLTGHTDIVFALAFDPTGAHLASGGDETVRLWDVAAQAEIGEPLIGHRDWVLSLAFSPDGTLLASGSADDTIRLWDPQSGTAAAEPLEDHTGWVRSLAFSPEGQYLASGSGDETVHVYDLSSGQVSVLGGHQDEVWSVGFTPDGRTLASASEDQTLRLWSVQATHGLGRLVARQDQTISGLALSPDGAWAASASGDPQGTDHTIHVWEVATGTERLTLEGHQQAVTDVAFSPDGKTLASGSADDTVRLWNLETGELAMEPLTGHQSAVTGVAFGPDGNLLASASQDHTVRLWDVPTGTLHGDPLAGHEDWVTSVAFDPTGKILATGSADASILLWDVDTAEPIGAPLTGHTDEITRLAFSADGLQLASASRDGTVRLWDVATRQPSGQPLVGHQNWVLDVAFKPDESILVTSSRDQTLILWDLETGQPIGQPLTGASGWVNRVVFGPDGHIFFSGDQSGGILRWPSAVDAWRDRACAIANRNLTSPEWQRYLHEAPYHQTCPELGS